MNLDHLQQALAESDCSGWLLVDFRGSNPLARRALGLDPTRLTTRRWYYFVPRQGEPVKLVSAVEPTALADLPGQTRLYRSWQERESALALLLAGQTRIALEYSPRGANPAVAWVDAGTVELVRSFGVEVVSSEDLLQRVLARWSSQQIAQHREAARRLLALRDRAFARLRAAARAGEPLTDWQLQQELVAWRAASGLVADHPPIVATDSNTANPHFQPTAARQTPILPGAIVLIDCWGKLAEPGAVYADFTWMAVVSEQVPARAAALFALVAAARDAAIAFLTRAVEAGQPVRGFEVDRVARQVIERAGYGAAFVHRTGHNLGEEVHGEGVNLDDLETHDERQLLPGTAVSVEPGIYLEDLGVRSEVNVIIHADRVEVTGDPQPALAALLAPENAGASQPAPPPRP
jgi:Xaa-Pro aminopeptidase